jgi:hypothetical protein
LLGFEGDIFEGVKTVFAVFLMLAFMASNSFGQTVGKRTVIWSDTITELLSITPGKSDYIAITRGNLYATNNDGYALAFDPAATDAANNVTIWEPDSGNGRWFLLTRLQGTNSGALTNGPPIILTLNVPPGFSTTGSPATNGGTITITTALTNIVKGSGTGMSNAVPAVDYVPPGLIGTNSGLTMHPTNLLGRVSTGQGPVQYIPIGDGLSITTGILKNTLINPTDNIVPYRISQSEFGDSPILYIDTNSVAILNGATNSIQLDGGNHGTLTLGGYVGEPSIIRSFDGITVNVRSNSAQSSYRIENERIVPGSSSAYNLGAATNTWLNVYADKLQWGLSTNSFDGGANYDPEGTVVANRGSVWRNISNGKVWRKATGSGNTGWIELASTGTTNNIYNSDGKLTDNRVLDGGGTNTMTFQNLEDFVISSQTFFTLDAKDLYLSTGNAYSNLLSPGPVYVLSIDPVTYRADWIESPAGTNIVIDAGTNITIYSTNIYVYATNQTNLTIYNYTTNLTQNIFAGDTNIIINNSSTNIVINVYDASTNIYNSNGTVTSARVVDGASTNTMTFQNFEDFFIGANTFITLDTKDLYLNVGNSYSNLVYAGPQWVLALDTVTGRADWATNNGASGGGLTGTLTANRVPYWNGTQLADTLMDYVVDPNPDLNAFNILTSNGPTYTFNLKDSEFYLGNYTLPIAGGYGTAGARIFSFQDASETDNNRFWLYSTNGADSSSIAEISALLTNPYMFLEYRDDMNGYLRSIRAQAGSVAPSIHITNGITGLTLRAPADVTLQTFIEAHLDGTNIFRLSRIGELTGISPITGDTNFYVSAQAGYTGAGNLFLSDDGSYKAAGGVNPTSGYVPYNNGGTFADSPWYRINTNSLGFNGTTQFVFAQNAINNVAIGIDAMSLGNSVSGTYNTAFGAASLYSLNSGEYNTASGFDSLASLGSANGNSAFGSGALHDTSTGPFNSGLGYRAGYTNTTGQANVFIGYNANPNANTDTNHIVIGANAIGRGSNTATVGANGVSVLYLNGTVGWFRGTGTPEGAVTAPVGSFYSREDGGANTSFYVKESGSGNTGWVGK